MTENSKETAEIQFARKRFISNVSFRPLKKKTIAFNKTEARTLRTCVYSYRKLQPRFVPGITEKADVFRMGLLFGKI